MGKAATQRALVADRRVGNMGDGRHQQRRMARDVARSRDLDMPRQRANSQGVAGHGDALQFSDLSDIDDQFGRDQPQIHRWHQALAAGEHFGLVAVGGEQLQSILNARCACIAESRGLHAYDLLGGVWSELRKRFNGGADQRSSLFIERLFRNAPYHSRSWRQGIRHDQLVIIEAQRRFATTIEGDPRSGRMIFRAPKSRNCTSLMMAKALL